MAAERTGLIHYALPEWVDFVSENIFEGEVNFWTKPKRIWPREGQTFFMKYLGTIIAYAEIKRIEKRSVKDAWLNYGIRNGVASFEDFVTTIRKSNMPIDNLSENTVLLCIILTNFVKTPPIDCKAVGLGRFQSFMYLDEGNIAPIRGALFAHLSQNNLPVGQYNGFIPKMAKSIVNSRLFQKNFREAVLNLYDEKCIVCGCDTLEILEAAHIVGVSDDLQLAADPENGLCMCRNHHRLYDKGILEIDAIGNVSISGETQYIKTERKVFGSLKLNFRGPRTAKYITVRKQNM